jgi:hypothetical protein
MAFSGAFMKHSNDSTKVELWPKKGIKNFNVKKSLFVQLQIFGALR